MTDLIALTRQQITTESLDGIAALMGTDIATATALLSGAVPLLVGSRGTRRAGIDALLAAASPAGAVPLETALALLAGLFGPKVELMARALAGATGSTISAATRALAIATPLLGNAITATLATNGTPPTRDAAMKVLTDNQPAAIAAMPGALRQAIGRLSGLAGLYPTRIDDGRRDFTWIALAALLLLAMLIVLLQG